MNEQCCICQSKSKKLISIFDKKCDITFADMIRSLSNIQVIKQEMGIFICRRCSLKLEDSYDLKKSIERSQVLLATANCQNRIVFNTLSDIAEQMKDVGLEVNNTNSETRYEITILDDNNSILYGDTSIKLIKTEDIDVDSDLKLNFNEYSESDFDNEQFEECQSKTPKRTKIHRKILKLAKPLAPVQLNDVILYTHKEKVPVKEKNEILAKENVKSNKIKLATPLVPIQIDDLKPKFHSSSKTPYVVGPDGKKKYQYPTVCPYCGIVSKHIKSHLLVHSERTKYECAHCSKIFLHKKSFMRHVEIHTGEGKRNFQCDHCLKAFYDVRTLNEHLLIHSGKRPFPCDICGAEFKRKTALRRHMNLHNPVRHLSCDYCPLTFNDKRDFTIHLKKHSGILPYTCELCKKQFGQKGQFNKHCLRLHGIYFNFRTVSLLNEEVLVQEKELMTQICLKMEEGDDGSVWNPFSEDQAGRAFVHVVKALKSGLITVHL